MRYVAREFQKPITSFMVHRKRGNIWATMGSGKTGATLKAISRMIAFALLDGPVLVCAPWRVAAITWPDEAIKWGFPNIDRVVPIVGTPAQREAALREVANVYSINYENLPWLIEYLGKNWFFAMCVADESTRLKSFRTRQGGSRAKALSKVAFLMDRFFNLTGTPAPNGYADLWGQQYFIDAGKRLGTSFTAYQDRYYRPLRNHGSEGGHGQQIEWVIRPGSGKLINRKLSDCTITVDAADFFDVEEARHVTIPVVLPKKARKVYEEMEQQFFAELEDGEIEAMNTAGKSGKLLQLAAGAVYLTVDGEPSKEWEEVHKAKLDALESIIEESAGEPILLAYHWKHDLARILKRFPQARQLDKKAHTQRQWNRGRIPLLCAHPSSAGHGLNLADGGCTVVFFSEWYDAETHMQIIERVGPIRQVQAGHPRVVTVYHIRADDTIDVAVAANLSGKVSTDKAIRDYMKAKKRKKLGGVRVA